MHTTTLPILALQCIPRYGRKTITRLLEKINIRDIKSSGDLYKAIMDVNISANQVDSAWREAEDIIKNSIEHGIKILSSYEETFPKSLLDMEDHPILLHILGDPEILHSKCITIVGTRNPDNFGTRAAKYATDIALKHKYVVVSGLANGVDTFVQQRVVDQGGSTIAVLAHGLHKVLPRNNTTLARNIVLSGGAIISEYPHGEEENKGYFIERDRIQSALSEAVIVVQTSITGGTMHTVKYAKKYNKKVFVIKTDDSSNSSGNEMLINNGATAITLGDDFLLE